MKRISLVTWLGNSNYGTCLQSYALYQKLLLLGYDVSYLKPFNPVFGIESKIKYCLYLLGIYQLLRKIKYSRTAKLRKIFKFQNEKYDIKNIYTKGQCRRLLATTDVFVTGSDQIWNAWYRFDPYFFLSFAGDCKRIAYASSIGTNTFPKVYQQEIKEHLLKFTHIGVREKTAVPVLHDLLGKNGVIQVLDPTFLLYPEDWSVLSSEADIEFQLPKIYMLCYLIGNSDFYVQQLYDVKAKYGIENVIVIPAAENPDFKVENVCIYHGAGPSEFVKLIQNATLVCTDSFHATAISINCSIDFVEFLRFDDSDEKSQNSRIYDLLDHYNLRNRLYSSTNESWINRIDYTLQQEILFADRQKSLSFLISSIES